MALTNTVTGTYTLDESSGLETGADGTPSGTPRDDSDISLAKLQTDAAAFYTYLFTTKAFQSSSVIGTAESGTSIINVQDTSGGTISSIGLTDSSGGAFDGTQSSGLFTTSNHEIFLVSDLNNQVVLGMYDSNGDNTLDAVAYAVYMKPDGALDSNVDVQLFSVTFTPLQHPIAGSDTQAYDDSVDLLQNVYVHSTGELHINFDQMPSGANLFNDAAESASGGGIIVFGLDPIVQTSGKSAGKYTNESDYISTSQGGTGATIGVNSQMFNPNDGAFFTYVNDILDTYLSGAKGGLSATEADYGQNMRYANLIEAHTASVHISQIQDANNPAGVLITAYDLNDDYQGLDLLSHRGGMNGGGTKATIDHVVIYASDGHTVLADSNVAGPQNGITIVINSGVANVQGLSVADVIEWHTTGVHNQVSIENNSAAGKFDIGGFDIREGSSDTDSLAGHSFVEDSGPKIGDSDGVSAAIANAIVSYPGDTDNSGHTDVSSVTNTLGGLVGTDPNSSAYDLTSWTQSVSFNGITLTAVPNATGSDPVTAVGYWQDTNGTAGIQTSGANPDTEFYSLTLNQSANSGAGSYTFTVLKDPPVVEQHFGFGAQPSGQNLFGIIPGGPAVGSVVPEGGLLFFNSNVHVDSAGKYISSNSDPSLNSGTVNTSQGGGAVSIGYGANNYTAAGQNAFFVFADNPNTAAVSGMGLDATTADDADTVNFNGLNPTTIASVDIVKTVSSTEAGVTIKAWNLFDAQMNMSDNNPTNETRDFLTNPLTFGTDATNVDITGVQVFRVTHSGQTTTSTLVYAAQDTNNSHSFAGAEITTNTGNVTVALDANGDVTVTGMDTNADYTIKYNTASAHDMAEVDYAAGSYNIGGFSRFTALDTPDKVLDFTARVTDGDGDTATASWHIGVDGTGVNDDGLVSGVSVI
jgi:hypothetical protein